MVDGQELAIDIGLVISARLRKATNMHSLIFDAGQSADC